mgnify:FL=1|tara:strand:- start:232 stop:972 length:741 start_codon:yes stop_codon:yes gene_type:complete
MIKLKKNMWEFANPNNFLRITNTVFPLFMILTIITLSTGIVWGLFFTPEDYRQGSSVKIIYIHVPTAFLAINIYFMMFVTSIIWLIRRHHVSLIAAKSAAPIGFIMTLSAILTGAIWGKPIWGTYWAWDPRLTSFSILLMFYLGYLSIWQTMKFSDKVGDLSAWLCIVGSVFALLSRYAVFFWDQGLHQGASLSLDKKENIDDVFYFPLLLCISGFVFLFVTLLLTKIKTEIKKRKLNILINIGNS